MRRFLLVSNAFVAITFLFLFAYTFVASAHIDQIARSYLTRKTAVAAEPVVAAAEKALNAPLTQRLLPAAQEATLKGEIAEYRANPGAYIADLTSAAKPKKPEGLLSKASEKLRGWKDRIREHYDRMLGRLLIDLRIFAASNAIAACLAFGLAYKDPDDPALELIVVSFFLLVAVGIATWSYIKNLSFFTILLDWHLGWGYPLLILGILFYLCWESWTARVGRQLLR